LSIADDAQIGFLPGLRLSEICKPLQAAKESIEKTTSMDKVILDFLMVDISFSTILSKG
jgi:hypothetical protein